jgi:hypothetical protein
MPEADWLEARREFLRDLERESSTLRQRAVEAERELHALGESLEGDTIDSVGDAGESGEKDPRLLRFIAASCTRAAAQADNLTEELRGLISVHEELEPEEDEDDG